MGRWWRRGATTLVAVVSMVMSAVVPPAGAVYTGVSVDGALGLVPELDAYTGSAGGKGPAIVMDYRDWAHTPDFPADFANLVAGRGGIPMITWEPWDPSAGPVQPAYQLADITAGTYDTYIRRWASQVRTYGGPVMLRFAHEMNGDWYPWAAGVNGNTAARYVQAWRRVVTLFRQAGVTNVTWVWAPNVSYPGTTALNALYPGDAYVDWTGLDGYSWGSTAPSGWLTFEQVFGPSIAQVRALSSRPLMIAEVGSAEQGGDKAAWITDFFARLAARPEIRGFVWFNHDKEADWRIQSSDESRIAYASAVANARYR